MKSIIIITALIASVGTASAKGASNDIGRFATPNTIAKLSATELRQVNGYISSGRSAFEIRAIIKELTK